MEFNDLNIEDWKQSDIDVNSLWIIPERDKRGKHSNIYHGNFIPQIPNQLIRRYTKNNETVFEPFMGSGTTLFECETLKRKYIGFDINPEMTNYVESQMQTNLFYDKYFIATCDASSKNNSEINFKNAFYKLNIKSVQFIIMHPPYLDIIKFTDNENDLSNIDNLKDFISKFIIIAENSLKYLDKNRYFAIVLGDVYKNSEVVPLSFYVMDSIKRNFDVKLKGIVIKNIEGNRGKLGAEGIWKYRALKSDYYIFKHEYIFVFKKEF